ncbi:MAG: tetratricopeptide repeat protein [Acidobacteria bacterium]|nr:tetratricopeptide repeat protein [Acidobacteriota bacterium]
MSAWLAAAWLLGAGAPEPRDVPVVFAVDPSFRSRPSWRDEVERALGEAERLFGPFGLRFSLAAVVTWAPEGGSVEHLLDALRLQTAARPPGIVAGITGRTAGPGVRGLASYRDARLVVAAPARARWRGVWIHELAHVFGAVHLEGERGLAAATDPGEGIDDLTGRLLALHRRRRFAPHLFPLPEEALAPAAALYGEALARSPVEARLLLAQIALERGAPGEALSACDEILGRVPGDVEALNVRGIALRRLGRLDEALEAYEEVLRRRPGQVQARFNLAIALDRLGRRDAAVEAYRRAVAQDPLHAPALSNLARLQARRGDTVAAEEAARRALAIAPDFVEARLNLVLALLAAGRPALAEPEARRAVTEEPTLAEAHEALGAALLALGRADEATASFASAVALAPSEARLWHHLGRARVAGGHTAPAVAAFEEAVRRAPRDAAMASGLADLYLATGRKADAREAYRRLVALRPEDGAAHNNLAVLLFRDGDVAGARRHAEAARERGVAVHPEFLAELAAAEEGAERP